MNIIDLNFINNCLILIFLHFAANAIKLEDYLSSARRVPLQLQLCNFNSSSPHDSIYCIQHGLRLQ